MIETPAEAYVSGVSVLVVVVAVAVALVAGKGLSKALESGSTD